MVGGFWTINANRKATIYLRNNLETSSLMVRPNVYLSNGVRYQLDSVELAASGTAVISINEALNKNGISPWATLSGYVEVEYTWAWDSLCVTVTSVDPIHSVIFSYGLQPSLVADLPVKMGTKISDGANAVDGMWWKTEVNAAICCAVKYFIGTCSSYSSSERQRQQAT